MEATMKERTSPRPNLTDYVADLRRKKRPTFLDDIEEIVDWLTRVES